MKLRVPRPLNGQSGSVRVGMIGQTFPALPHVVVDRPAGQDFGLGFLSSLPVDTADPVEWASRGARGRIPQMAIHASDTVHHQIYRGTLCEVVPRGDTHYKQIVDHVEHTT